MASRPGAALLVALLCLLAARSHAYDALVLRR